MVLGQYNIEFFGVGIHLFAFVIALVLFLWNITFENSSGRSSTVNLLLIFSMIRTLNKAALLIILPTYPAFFMSMTATIMVFIAMPFPVPSADVFSETKETANSWSKRMLKLSINTITVAGIDIKNAG